MPSDNGEKRGGTGTVFFISLSQFWVNFSFNFMFAFLPFYINRISPYTPEQTLLWTGLIFGATSMAVAFSGPFWGSLTHRISPKSLYLAGLTVHCLTFVAMAFTTSLPVFLFIRVLQGFFGGTATIGVIMISLVESEQRPRDIGIFQSSITFGQLIGPTLGSLGVAFLGYPGCFLSAGAVVAATLVLCYFFVPNPVYKKSAAERERKGRLSRAVIVTWLLCLVAQVQLMLLPSILPDVFRSLGLIHEEALRRAGLTITLYTLTSMVGTYFWCSMARRWGTTRLITALMIGGIILQAALMVPQGFIGFVAVRMVQTGLIAAVIPLGLALFAENAGGFTMGFLYSSRFVGNAIGPVLATSLVAYSNIPALYVSVSVVSLIVLVLFRFVWGKPHGTKHVVTGA
jgi:MFS transporter, DHA1 family, multidrug resistance protein